MKWYISLPGTLLLLCASVAADPARFDDFKMFRVSIETQEQMDALQSVTTKGETSSIRFMDPPVNIGQELDIVVPPHQQATFDELIESIGLKSLLLISNLQPLVEEGSLARARSSAFGWDDYYRVDEIYAWLDSLAVAYPDIVTRIKGGDTYEGRSIEGVKLSKNASNPAIFIESNTHAREWLTSASTTWIINELLVSTDPEIQALLNNFNWYIFPVVNPDGYEYSHTTDRMWRKTRSPQGPICWGTDPNRNWDNHWQLGGYGSSDNPCADTYAGPTAFSEIETKSLSNFLLSIKDEIKIYLSFHSAARMILSPWSHTQDLPRDHEKYMKIMTSAYERLHAVHGTVYKFGNGFDVICRLSFRNDLEKFFNPC